MANTADNKTILENPLIFMSNLKFRNFKDLIAMLEFAANNNRPLLIFCNGMDGSALNNILMNIMNKTVECAVVLAPNFGDQQLDELGDIQSLVGGTLFTEESKDSASSFVSTDFGNCERIIINKERTIIVGGEGDSSRSHMGGISQAQADAVGAANKAAGMTGWGLRDGGLATMFKEKR